MDVADCLLRCYKSSSFFAVTINLDDFGHGAWE